MTKSRNILSPRAFWTATETEQLRGLYPSTPTSQIARTLGRDVQTVYAKAAALGLHKSEAYLESPHACRLRRGDNIGADYRYPKGHVPANKGLRRPGWSAGRMADTQFKKGELNGVAKRRWVPIGSLRVNGDGYLDRKVRDDGPSQNRWRSVHRLVWEAAYGPIPKDNAVAFMPGQSSTDVAKITLDALEMITRGELMRRNTYHKYPQPIPKLIQLRGALNRQINKRTRIREEQDRRPAQSSVRHAGGAARRDETDGPGTSEGRGGCGPGDHQQREGRGGHGPRDGEIAGIGLHADRRAGGGRPEGIGATAGSQLRSVHHVDLDLVEKGLVARALLGELEHLDEFVDWCVGVGPAEEGDQVHAPIFEQASGDEQSPVFAGGMA